MTEKSPIPFAQFRHNGVVVSMQRDVFIKSVAEGQKCGCGECVHCRAAEYWRDYQELAERS